MCPSSMHHMLIKRNRLGLYIFFLIHMYIPFKMALDDTLPG